MSKVELQSTTTHNNDDVEVKISWRCAVENTEHNTADALINTIRNEYTNEFRNNLETI